MQMEVTYLGIFSWLFDAIFGAILSPIFKFIAGLLEPAITWLFDNVLAPLLKNVLWPLFQMLLDLILDIFSGILYRLMAQVMEIVDALQQSFNIFAGIQKVSYAGKQDLPLIEVVFRLDVVQKAVLIIAAIGFVLTMGFAVVATMRSMMDLDGENNRPVSKVLSSTMKAMLKMLIVPFACFFAIRLSGELLLGIHSAMGADQTTLGRMVFVVSSLDASRTAELNISGTVKNDDKPVKISGDIGIGDKVRKPYYEGSKSYTNTDQVEKDFVFKRFDFLIGFGASLFLIVILFVCLVNFVTRIFEVIMLFIVAPLFASVQPLDDGDKFRAWQEMFVSKLFGGFGTVIGMELYMILCPVVMNGQLAFVQGSTEANYLLRIVFLLGGAWATLKVGPTVTGLLSASAGQMEAESSARLTHTVVGAGAAAVAVAGGAGSWLINRARSGKSGGEDGKGSGNRYTPNNSMMNGQSSGTFSKNVSNMNGGAGGSGSGGYGGSGGSGGSGAFTGVSRTGSVGGQIGAGGTGSAGTSAGSGSTGAGGGAGGRRTGSAGTGAGGSGAGGRRTGSAGTGAGGSGAGSRSGTGTGGSGAFTGVSRTGSAGGRIGAGGTGSGSGGTAGSRSTSAGGSHSTSAGGSHSTSAGGSGSTGAHGTGAGASGGSGSGSSQAFTGASVNGAAPAGMPGGTGASGGADAAAGASDTGLREGSAPYLEGLGGSSENGSDQAFTGVSGEGGSMEGAPGTAGEDFGGEYEGSGTGENGGEYEGSAAGESGGEYEGSAAEDSTAGGDSGGDSGRDSGAARTAHPITPPSGDGGDQSFEGLRGSSGSMEGAPGTEGGSGAFSAAGGSGTSFAGGQSGGTGTSSAGSAAGRAAASALTGSSRPAGRPAPPQSPIGKAGLQGYLGDKGRFTWNTSTGGHHYVGLNMGKAATLGRDENNNFRARFLGVGARSDASGKVDKVYLPFVRLSRGNDGNMHVSQVKLGGLKFKRAATVTQNSDGTKSRSYGDMYCSDFSPIGLKRRFDDQTGNVERQSLLGTHYEKNAQGAYVKSYSDRLVHKEYAQDAQGKSHVVARDGKYLHTRYSLNPDGTTTMTGMGTSGGKTIYTKREDNNR